MVEQDNVEIPDISSIIEEDIDNDDCDCVRESHFYSFENNLDHIKYVGMSLETSYFDRI